MYPTMSYNQLQHGIELSFPGVPSRDIRDQMKANGFRYHREKNIWFAKQNEARDAFARGLCGEAEIAKKEPGQETLYRYYSRRPVDLGTYPKRDGSPVNIVNFDSRIPVEDGRLTAWGYVEYSKPLSDKDTEDYELTPAMDYAAEKKSEKAEDTNKGKQPEKPAKPQTAPNTFAASYDSIGDTPILADGNVTMHTHYEAYIKDLNIAFRRFGSDSIHITELDNAGKNGKACAQYAIYMKNRYSNDSVVCQLMNEHKIDTVSQLYAALKEQRDLGEAIQIDKREQKGVETFSPFVETKPLSKLPERWNKRNFTNALLSGQIYGGQIDQVLTDDYLYDAATNFREGVPINVPCAARNAVEDWSSLASVHSSNVQPDGTCKLDYYNGYSTSKTFYFDLHCNIKEGKRREEEKAAGIKRHNDMLMRSCIKVSQESIDPGKIYTLTTVDTGTNSGVYGTEKETLQGHVLRYRLDPEHIYMDILGVSELQIQPDKLYSVSNFHNRRSEHEKADDRIIDCGNWQNIVTGKALLEMTAEGLYFPEIREAYGEHKDFETARKTLQSFASGKSRFMLGNNSTDYNHSLSCLEKEYARATAKRGLDDVIRSAQVRTADNGHSGRGTPEPQR